jgi:hypothetical protein
MAGAAARGVTHLYPKNLSESVVSEKIDMILFFFETMFGGTTIHIFLSILSILSVL